MNEHENDSRVASVFGFGTNKKKNNKSNYYQIGFEIGLFK